MAKKCVMPPHLIGIQLLANSNLTLSVYEILLKYLYELGSSMQTQVKARLLLGIKLRLLFLKAVNIIN